MNCLACTLQIGFVSLSTIAAECSHLFAIEGPGFKYQPREQTFSFLRLCDSCSVIGVTSCQQMKCVNAIILTRSIQIVKL